MGSPEVILLDTHAAIWLVTDNDALGRQSRTLAVAALADGQLAVSAITFWEIALLVAKGRLASLDSAADVRRQIVGTGLTELPLTGDIALLAVELKHLHADPADRFIAATAVTHEAILVTADARLLRWRHQVRRQNASH
jgi:PIN domain nuclease of toxin-antitoxin system